MIPGLSHALTFVYNPTQLKIASADQYSFSSKSCDIELSASHSRALLPHVVHDSKIRGESRTCDLAGCPSQDKMEY